MDYPDRFFEKEVRDGFEISSMMKRCWAVEMDMVREIDAICKRHGLRWFADAGTLLGAVREHGFIPWDDDIDIAMNRRDYEGFRKYAKEELPEGYMILNDRSGTLSENFYGLANSDKPFCLDEAFLEKNHDFPYAVSIDIFVFDNVPDDEEEREIYIKMFSYAYAAGAEVGEGMEYQDCTEEVQGWIGSLELLSGQNIRQEKNLKQKLLLLADQIAAMYYDADVKYVAQAWKLAEDPRMIFEGKWFEDLVDIPFENMMMPVPVGYHDALSVRYGDYMKKVRAGVATHEYPAYKKYARAMYEWFEKKGKDVPERFCE